MADPYRHNRRFIGYAPYILNRNNTSAWITTGSVDSDNTYIDVDMVDYRTISDILLIKHNFKNFTIQYWNGSAFVDFSPAIAETVNTAESNYYQVAQVQTSKVRIKIFGTMTPNEDKHLYQFILTEKIGQFEGWPVIKNPKHSKNKVISKMISGKYNVLPNVSGFSCSLGFNSISSDADLTLIENIYDEMQGFLFWPCGGSETQFKTVRQGYQLEDVYLMACQNDYEPEYLSGIYNLGIGIEIKMIEVVD
jgi:hypothetical protein